MVPMNASRKEFAEFLQKLINDGVKESGWHDWIVNHYQDEVVESIRVQVSRLSFHEKLLTPGGRLTPEAQQQVIAWRDILLHSDDTESQ